MPSEETETAKETSIPGEEKDVSLKEARLIVNGQDITEGNYVRINHAYCNAEIPVIIIFQELGYDVEVNTDGEVIIDNDYVLLKTKEQDFGIAIYDTEPSAVRKVLDGEFVVDVFSVIGWWYRVFNIDIEIDFSANAVYVTTFDPDTYEEHRLQLIVNGRDITEGNEAYLQEYYTEKVVKLPVLAIMNELGAEITWDIAGLITIRYDGKEIEYDLKEADFGSLPPTGGTVIRKATKTEVYMDLPSVRTTLKSFTGADICVNYDEYVVHVNFFDYE
jgi:hypothetical protein